MMRIRFVGNNDEGVENNDFLSMVMDFGMERIFIKKYFIMVYIL